MTGRPVIVRLLFTNTRGIAALATYLGHHDPGFTLRTYVHLMPDAADRMRSVVHGALSPEADGPGTAREATE
jgi:hypothetical protein